VRFLLDTHIWLWSLLEPRRLSRKVANAFRSGRNELWLSPISCWEALVLAERGRLRLSQDPLTWVAQALEKVPLVEAPITYEIAIESRRVPLPHRDPADGLLVATARVLDLTLVTADERLLSAKGFRSFPNR
jgi:PIN domain nuclease of toxin-antitoxin system